MANDTREPPPYEDSGDADRSAQVFIMRARQMAEQNNGVCCMEYFTCSRCGQQQVSTHPFAESIPCQKCQHRNASKMPRLPQRGEVTKEMLDEAIRLVKVAYQRPSEATKEWMDRHEGAVRTFAIAWACEEVHRAMDTVREFARAMSGGHGE